jgi:hypothetical protein
MSDVFKMKDELKLEYAEAYVLPQPFKDLYDIKTAFERGTIFNDLYRPYEKKKHGREY